MAATKAAAKKAPAPKTAHLRFLNGAMVDGGLGPCKVKWKAGEEARVEFRADLSQVKRQRLADAIRAALL